MNEQTHDDTTQQSGWNQLEIYLRLLVEGEEELDFNPDVLAPHNGIGRMMLEIVSLWRKSQQRARTLEQALRDHRNQHAISQQVLAVLKQLGDVTATTFETQEICQAGVEVAVRELDVGHSALFLLDREHSQVVLWAAADTEGALQLPGPDQPPPALALGEGIVGRVLRDGMTVCADSLAECKCNPLETTLREGSMLSLPLHAGAFVVGALNISAPEQDFFQEQQVRELRIFSRFLGLALHAANAHVRFLTAERQQMLSTVPQLYTTPEKKPDDEIEPLQDVEEAAVLIASGNPERLPHMQDVLGRLGIQSEALPPDADRAARRQRIMELAPDALLVDVSAPGEGGWPLLYQLVVDRMQAYFPLLLCGFDEAGEQGWLGHPTAIDFKPLRADRFGELLQRCAPEKYELALLVENNPLHILQLYSWLEGSFEQVVTAIDGVQGIDAMTGERPDWIVCDALMPDRCGLQLLAELARGKQADAPPCLFLLPERPTPEEEALLVKDAEWTAAMHGLKMSGWARLLRFQLENSIV